MRNLHTFFDRFFLTRLLRSEAGRAYVLQQLADAEGGEGGELLIFDQLAAHVDDEKLQQLIRVHKEDEERHEGLFLHEIDKLGVAPVRIPERLKLLIQLDARMGGWLERDVETDEHVLESYLLLLVVEERAMSQFELLAEVFASHGAHDTAAVLRSVAADEERHLRYCHAITKRYAKSEEERQRRIAEVRQAEAEVYLEVGLHLLDYTLEHGLIENPVDRVLFRGVRFLGAHLNQDPPTAHSQLPAHALAIA